MTIIDSEVSEFWNADPLADACDEIGCAHDNEALLVAIRAQAAEIARLAAERDELKFAQEKFDEDAGDNQRLIDRIADLIGLPKETELDQTAFELWFGARGRELADAQAEAVRLRSYNAVISKTVADLERERDEARAALEPFSKAAKWLNDVGGYLDTDKITHAEKHKVGEMIITVGDLRKALGVVVGEQSTTEVKS